MMAQGEKVTCMQFKYVAYGHNSGLSPREPPIMVAEKRELLFSFLFFQVKYGAITHDTTFESASMYAGVNPKI